LYFIADINAKEMMYRFISSEDRKNYNVKESNDCVENVVKLQIFENNVDKERSLARRICRQIEPRECLLTLSVMSFVLRGLKYVELQL
jgi:hypothetical protein